MRFIKPVCIILFLLLPFIGSMPAVAQTYENIYRPTLPDWQQLQTNHFKILYQDGEESAAVQTAHILEDQYSVVQSLVGGSLSDMPVVLNGKNDRSNGYVSTLNFRIEVEIPRIKGKTMNPLDGNWLQTVMPHELVHALHLNVIPPFGVSGMIRPFSPDVARTMHLAAPLGMIEGIAVFHESHRQYGISGRGNHPYFTQQFQSVFNSRKRWSLDQMLKNPLRTFPFDRHYIGGHEFIHWLQYEYGMEITKNTIRFVSRWPFLGYGSALWYHTGERPSKLFRRFEQEQKQNSDNPSVESRNSLYPAPSVIKSERVRRPFWISDEILLFHAVSYKHRPGFYSFDTKNNSVDLFLETGTVEDHVISINSDRSRFLYARYHRHPYYENHARMNVHEVQINDGNAKSVNRIPDADRIHAPVYGPGQHFWALQTRHERNHIISVSESGSESGIDTLLIPDEGHIVEMAFRPGNPDSLALLGNRNGLQGLWFLHRDHLEEYQNNEPHIAFERASVYDPVWHPDGNRLMFTSDVNETMNLFEYDLREEKLYRLTEHKYGIMEGSYSPDGNRVAAVQIRENRFELVILEKDELLFEQVSGGNWKEPSFAGPSPQAETSPDSLPDEWEISSYQTGFGWLRPRAFFPYWENESSFIGNRFGVTLSSGDVLRRNSYTAEISTSNNRIWYDFEYQFSGFYPGFRVRGYRRPTQTTDHLFERQGAGIEIPLQYHFDHNTRFSTLFVTPGFDSFRQRVIDTSGEVLGPWQNRTTANLFISYQHRLQQNLRDVQPNTGWVFFTEMEQDVHTDFANRLSALRAGIYRFLSFNMSSNQSLRLGSEWVTQNLPYFDISGFYSLGFTENVLAGENNATRFNTRYTIPLWQTDRGGVLFPIFFDTFYVTLFSDTVLPLKSRNAAELLNDSRSLYGIGLRSQLRIFNIPFDIGVGVAYEPTREQTGLIIGTF